MEQKKYKVIMTTTYTYEIDARNGDDAICKAVDNMIADEKAGNDRAKEETFIVEEI